jgi:hypothetical protein
MVQDTFDGDDNIYYTSSSDHGVSWSDLELVSDDTTVESWYPDIAADSAGHAYVVWYQPNASRGEIWFATNAPLGIAEQPERPSIGVQPSATVVRNVLFLPAENGDSPPERLRPTQRGTVPIFRDALLDISGREVMDLKPGANDVSKLAPGVYFVRAVSRELSAVSCQKVVVTR